LQINVVSNTTLNKLLVAKKCIKKHMAATQTQIIIFPKEASGDHTGYYVARVSFESGGRKLHGDIWLSGPKPPAMGVHDVFKLMPFEIEIGITSSGADNHLKFSAV
jgi:hypothetical protein